MMSPCSRVTICLTSRLWNQCGSRVHEQKQRASDHAVHYDVQLSSGPSLISEIRLGVSYRYEIRFRVCHEIRIRVSDQQLCRMIKQLLISYFDYSCHVRLWMPQWLDQNIRSADLQICKSVDQS